MLQLASAFGSIKQIIVGLLFAKHYEKHGSQNSWDSVPAFKELTLYYNN